MRTDTSSRWSPLVNGSERRRVRRFPLQQPVTLTVQDGSGLEIRGATRNVCMYGVLLVTNALLQQGTPVEITITMRSSQASITVQLCGSGTVVRTEAADNLNMLGIACHFPLKEVQPRTSI